MLLKDKIVVIFGIGLGFGVKFVVEVVCEGVCGVVVVVCMMEKFDDVDV